MKKIHFLELSLYLSSNAKAIALATLNPAGKLDLLATAMPQPTILNK